MPVNTPSKEYEATKPKWKRCRDIYNGSDSVKAAGTDYLPLLGSHKSSGDSRYIAYKARAVFYNAMARTVDALSGGIFQKAPEIKAPDVVIAQLADATLKDESVELFALLSGQEVLITGRRGILVDIAKDPRDGQTRPAWYGYAAEDIFSYRTSNEGGDEILTRVVLRERVTIDDPEDKDGFAVKEFEQYRVLELFRGVYIQTVWRENAEGAWKAGDVVAPTRRQDVLSFIPFTLLGPTTTSPRIAKPPLLDLVDMNISHYQTMADLEHGLHLVALPTPCVSGMAKPDDGKLMIGGDAIWFIDTGGEAWYLEFSGDGLGALERADESKRHKMTVLGSRMTEEQPQTSQSETAFAVNMRHAGEQATLRTIAGALETGLTLALQWHTWWVGSDETPGETRARFSLNKDFSSARMTPDEFRVHAEAYKKGAQSQEQFYYNLKRGDIARPGVTAEQELADIGKGKPEPPPRRRPI